MVFRTLRVPEKLFTVAMWAVSMTFAGFLIGLGGKIVGELPGVDQQVALSEFVDPLKRVPLLTARDSLVTLQRTTQDERERASQSHAVARNAYSSQRETFDTWIATRTATTDPTQDPEVVSRTRLLDALKRSEREAESAVEQLDERLLAISQTMENNREREIDLELSARGRFESARFSQELRVFAVRLALTLPLLLIAGWLVARKRRSEYWPLLRGFVLFAVFAFFVELVPYLPSYGGYVRYGVGIIASAVVGMYVIRAMRRYLAQRQRVELQSEGERRRALPYDEALRRIGAGVCPGCERAIAGGPANPSNFCVHCGLRLYDQCDSCHTRKNAFYPYCPTCGVPAADADSPTLADATSIPT
ncbi:zinc ribbon domain-containing protein [Gemmatimonas sp.]|uniref:zinc ribbon domain-containing protein n=1 Tax=Gemmatimonas sp. TaxID=1962908 RepID=UPI0039833929